MQRWYVVNTRPRAEAQAHWNLERQGFAAYLPRYRKTRRHARRVERVVTPLFPRYLFVNADLDRDRWRCLHSTVGVSRLLCHGELPTPVPDAVIAEIQSREDAFGMVNIGSAAGLRVGDRVRILDGAFADMIGVFESISDEARVTILLDLLGRQVKVGLPVHALSACA